MESQCVPGLTAEAKELKKKLVEYKKTDATAKTNPKSRGRKRAIATDKRMIAPEVELADTKSAHAQLIDVSIRSEAAVLKTRADLKRCKVHFCKVEQASKLSIPNLDDARKQPVDLATTKKKASRQLVKTFSQAQLLEDDINYF